MSILTDLMLGILLVALAAVSIFAVQEAILSALDRASHKANIERRLMAEPSTPPQRFSVSLPDEMTGGPRNLQSIQIVLTLSNGEQRTYVWSRP